MYYIEDNKFLKKQHIDYIKNVILNNNFPYFINKAFPNIELKEKILNLHNNEKLNKEQIRKKLKLPKTKTANSLIEQAIIRRDDLFLSHVILKRPEERNNNSYNSPHANFFESMFYTFCEKHNIKVKEIFRIAVNLTFNIGVKEGVIHQDHSFKHKQLIIYLNDCDKEAKTIILNKNNKKIKEIIPVQFKGACFDNSPHYLIYPRTGERIIAIYTFS
jgi:hypothetical protein